MSSNNLCACVLQAEDEVHNMAAQVSDVGICCWAYEGQTGRLRSALEDNAQLLAKKDSHERTALHWACASGQTEIVKILLKLGAEVEFNNQIHTRVVVLFDVACICNLSR